MLTLKDLPEGTAALWERIAEQMRRRIDSGLWSAGQQLLAEADLAKELGVARGTLRRAIKELCDSGHLEQRHGRGTFVASGVQTREPLAHRMESLGERMVRSGLPFETRELSRDIVPGGADYGLDAPDGVLVLRRSRWLEGSPVAVLSNAVPLHLFPGIQGADFSSKPLYTVLDEQYGAQFVHAERTFSAVAATAELASLLDVPPGTPLLHFSQISWGPHDVVLDVAETWIRSDRHQPAVTMWRTQ